MFTRYDVVDVYRHSITNSNVAKRYCGITDDPLNETGIQLVRDATFQPVHVCYTSGLTRAQQTAALMFPTAKRISDAAWNEYHFGDFEGKTYEQLKDVAAYREWLDDPQHVAPPNGETMCQFEQRIAVAWQRVIAERLSHCAIVTHGGVLRQLMSQLFPHDRDYWQWQTPFASGYRLFVERGDRRCISYADLPIAGNEVPH